MPGEVLSLHLGQAGVQIGNSVWELLSVEHSVLPSGKPIVEDEGRKMMFSETGRGQCVPRAVFCDLEPTCIDEIRIGPYRFLFKADCLISGKEDAASNFARGYYSIGNESSELCMDRLRREAEKCSGLQSIVIFRSFGGGTGSGLTANVADKIQRDFKKISVLEFSIYPSPRISPVIVEPYNAVLTTHGTIENSNCNFILDNEAIYEICEKKLDVKRPTYLNLNRLIAQIVSSTSCSSRFDSSLGIDLVDTLTNLIPFPRLHFPLISFAPLLPESRVPFESITTSELVSDTFRPSNQMIKVDSNKGKYMSSVLCFRGSVSTSDVNEAVNRVKNLKGITFSDFSPTGIKVGHCKEAMCYVNGADLATVPESLVTISNNTAVGEAWSRIVYKFDKMFARRAFVHHFVGEGMEEAEFGIAREDLKNLEQEYQKAGEDIQQRESEN